MHAYGHGDGYRQKHIHHGVMYTISYTYTYAYVIYMCASMCIKHQHIHIRAIRVDDYTAYVICYTTNITSVPADSMQPIF